MKKNAIILFVIFIITTSCKTGVEVTFTNQSNEKFKTLKVNAGKKYIIFENIESGESTTYLKLPGSFSYCFAQVITKKDTITFMPIDYMGEKYHNSGKLNMKLKIYTDEKGKRYLDFVN
ncbi:hypothetical protein [Flavobacterium pedocola]